jgi:DNA polymerase-3 subunit delta
LTPEEFRKSVASPSRKPFYLVGGTDPLAIDECLAAATEALPEEARAFNLRFFRLPEDDVEDALLAARTSGFFSRESRMVVVRAPDSFRGGGSKVGEALVAWQKRPAPDATVVLFQEKPDSRLKYAMEAKKAGAVVECPAPDRKAMQEWLRKLYAVKGITLTPEASRLMAERAGDSLRAMVNEADKLAIWPGPGKPIGPAVIRDQVPLGPGSIIYELAEPVAERRPPAAVPVLLDLLGSWEAFGVISALATHMRKLRALKAYGLAAPIEGRPLEAAAAELGLRGFYLSKLQAQCARWSLPELGAAMARVEDAYRMLFTTTVPPALVLEELCLGLSLPPPPRTPAPPAPRF